MALKINNGSIVYPNALIPTSGPWSLLYRATFIGQGTYLTIDNGADKKLTLGYVLQPNSDYFDGYIVNFKYSNIQNVSMRFGNLSSLFWGLIEYDGTSQLKLWDLGSTTNVSMNLAADFSGMTALTLSGSNIFAEDLTIWNSGWTAQDIIQAVQIPPHLMRNRYHNLVFFERFWSTLNNPHRTGIIKPVYTNVTLDDYTYRQFFSTVYTAECHNYRTLPNQAPNEYIIDIGHSMQFSQNGAEKTTKFNDTVRFVNQLGNNVRYLQINNVIKCTESITTTTKVENLTHLIFLIEQWETENELLIPSEKSEYLQIVEEITMIKDISRSVSNNITFHEDMHAYKQTPARLENFG